MWVHCKVTYVEQNGRSYNIDTDDPDEAKRQATELASTEWDRIISIRATLSGPHAPSTDEPRITTFDTIPCTHDAYRLRLNNEGEERPYCPTCDNWILL
jgi:hypothetical protein